MQHIRSTTRSAFTLVELLVVTVVISIMATIVLFALYGVGEEAREARTKSQIAKLNELVMLRWEQYRTRPVAVRIPAGQDPAVVAKIRLAALRELMRMELPDRKSDVLDGPTAITVGTVTVTQTRPSLHRRYQRMAAAGWTVQYQGAESLYLIMDSMNDGDGAALDFFSTSEIGDVDGDGMKEILDAWGKPIEFIRWPAGFRSVIQSGDAAIQPDTFDVLKSYGSNYALHPLIVSAGRDKFYDIYGIYEPGDTADSGATFKYSTAPIPNNPYANPGTQFGTQMDTGPGAGADGVIGYVDNLTNHIIETK